MGKRTVFINDNAELEVHPGEAGSVSISIKKKDMEFPILILLGKDDVNDLITTLNDLSNEMPSLVSIR